MSKQVTRNERTQVMEPTITDLERGLLIDEDGLDEALQQQPDLFYRAAKRLALLTSKRDKAKRTLQEVEAEANIRIRAGVPEGEKITNPEVDAQVLLDKSVKKAHAELMDLNYQHGQWSALKESFEQRSYALKDLVALHLSQHYNTALERDATVSRVREARRHSR